MSNTNQKWIEQAHEEIVKAIRLFREASSAYKKCKIDLSQVLFKHGLSESTAIGIYLSNPNNLPEEIRKQMHFLEAYEKLINIDIPKSKRKMYE